MEALAMSEASRKGGVVRRIGAKRQSAANIVHSRLERRAKRVAEEELIHYTSVFGGVLVASPLFAAKIAPPFFSSPPRKSHGSIVASLLSPVLTFRT